MATVRSQKNDRVLEVYRMEQQLQNEKDKCKKLQTQIEDFDT